MADAFVDSQRAAGLPARAREASGVNPKIRTITFETAATDAAGDVKRLFTVGAHEIPVSLRIMNDAIAGATDIDIGLYRPAGGVVVDKDALVDGLDISAGLAYAASDVGLGALAVQEQGIRTFAEIASDVVSTDVIGHIPQDSYDVCLTEVSEVTAAGTITVILTTIENQ